MNFTVTPLQLATWNKMRKKTFGLKNCEDYDRSELPDRQIQKALIKLYYNVHGFENLENDLTQMEIEEFSNFNLRVLEYEFV